MNIKIRNIISVFSFGLLDVSFIFVMLAALFKQYGFTPFTISVILTAKNISRLATDIPLGFLADKFGIKNIFIFARIARLISLLILLWFQSIEVLIISMVLQGISMSGVYGKMDSYLYKYLSAMGKKESFKKVISLYYLLCNLAAIVSGPVTSIIFAEYSYNGLIKASILITLISFAVWMVILDDNRFDATVELRKINLTEAFSNAISLLKKSAFIRYFIIMLGCNSAIIWQSGNIISMIAVNGVTSFQLLPVIYSFQTGCTLLGYFLSLCLSGYIDLSKIKIYLSGMTVMFLVSGLLYNYFTVVVFGLLLCLSPIIQVVCENYFEIIATKEMRATLTSLTTFTATLVNIAATLSFGYLATIFSHKVGFMLIISVLCIVILCSCSRSLGRSEKFLDLRV